tara:strand:- start:326 stop:640 length:315 start_codon:yes stop_codon:yes gene_type:complete
MDKIYFHSEAIEAQGSLAKFFYIVLSGKVLVLEKNGKNVLKIITENEVFGLIECLANKTWNNTFIAHQNAKLLKLPSESLYRFIKTEPFTVKETINNLLTLSQY